MLNNDEAEDTQMGLDMMGFTSELVEWLMSDNHDMVPQLNEVRRGVELYCARQSETQAHVE